MRSNRFKLYFERFKTISLGMLIILCIIQVGILWSTQSNRFPIYFFNSIFSNLNPMSQASAEKVKGEFLLPSKVVLSAGYEKEHYIVGNGSKDYKSLWDNATQYLTKALQKKPKQIKTFNEDDWGKLVANKPYIFEFKTPIPTEIFEWVLNSKNSSEIGNIYKFIICPEDQDNNYQDTVYIRSDKNIYTFDLEKNSGGLGGNTFSVYYNELKSNTYSRNYEMVLEKYPNPPIKISQDMLLPIATKSFESYPDIEVSPFVSGQLEGDAIYNQISKKLLGSSRNDYDPDEDVNKSIVFKKMDSVYRINKDSIIEYKYIGDEGSYEKLKVLDAYKNAIDFIINHCKNNNMLSGVTVYLSEIKQNEGSYTFKFDYSINLENEQVPILIHDFLIPENQKKLNSMIELTASTKRVLNCEWFGHVFTASDKVKPYQWSFPSMIDKMYEAYPKLKNMEFSAQQAGIYYVISNNSFQLKQVRPKFVVFTKDGNYDIQLKQSSN